MSTSTAKRGALRSALLTLLLATLGTQGAVAGPPLPVDPPDPPLPSTKTTLLEWTLYKGDLHSHPRGHAASGDTTPRRSPFDVYLMARLTGLDFFAITDHDISEGSPGRPGGFLQFNEFENWRIWHNYPGWTFATDYQLNRFNAQVHLDEAFIPIVGYERTGQAWNHLNIFDMEEWVHDDGGVLEGTTQGTLRNLGVLIGQGKRPLIQFNHPLPWHWNAFAFDPIVAQHTHLMELGTCKPNDPEQEPCTVGWPLPSAFESFRLALNKGWKLSPTVNSDRHSDNNSSSFPGHATQDRTRTGIALPQSQPLGRTVLLDAMRERRTFAASTPHLAAMYTANGQPMGSVLPAGPVAIRFRAVDTSDDRADAQAMNVCAAELWSSVAAAPLRVYPNPQRDADLEWDFTIPSPYHGNYFFVLKAAHACNAADPSSGEATLVTAPIWTPAALPQVVDLPWNGVPASKPYTFKWSWPGAATVRVRAVRLGNGATQAEETVTNIGQHTWNTYGWPADTYRIVLADAAYDSYEWSPGYFAVTNQPPTAAFTFTSDGLTATFTNTSSDPDAACCQGVMSHAWNFGDGTTSSVASPTRTFAAPGTYSVRLTVTDNGGATHSVTKAVVVPFVAPPALTVESARCYGKNTASWTAVSGATSYRLFLGAGTDPNTATQFWSGTALSHPLDVSSSTNVWAKACGAGGCSGFSNRGTAARIKTCNPVE